MMHNVADLLTELEAFDFIGALLAPFIDTFGPITWGFFTLIFLLPLHGRLGTMPLVVLGMAAVIPLLWVVPSGVFAIGYTILKYTGGIALGLLVVGVVTRLG